MAAIKTLIKLSVSQNVIRLTFSTDSELCNMIPNVLVFIKQATRNKSKLSAHLCIELNTHTI